MQTYKDLVAQYGEVALSNFAQQMANLDPARHSVEGERAERVDSTSRRELSRLGASTCGRLVTLCARFGTPNGTGAPMGRPHAIGGKVCARPASS
jgi:hypothetical protein